MNCPERSKNNIKIKWKHFSNDYDFAHTLKEFFFICELVYFLLTVNVL